MQRTLQRLLKQISVITGKAYDEGYSKELAKHNFPSPYWIGESALKKLNIGIRAGQEGQGIALKNGALFNAAQTVDPSRVESLSGKLCPVFALSGAPLRADGEQIAMVSSGKNAWLTEGQMKKLNLTLKPGAKHVSVTIENKEKKCYALESFVEGEKVEKALEVEQVALGSGMPYGGSTLATLIRVSMDKQYTSGLWLTKSRIEKLGCELKENESPVVIAGADTPTELYCADQLVDMAPALAKFEESQKHQISGLSGKFFPPSISETLYQVKKQNPSYSRFWLTASMAMKEKSIIGAEEPFEITEDGKTQRYFNASQLKGHVLKQCMDTYRKAKRAYFKN